MTISRANMLLAVGLVLALTAAMLTSCGKLNKSTPAASTDTSVKFWAADFVNNAYYQTAGTKIGEGTHCYLYLEQGRTKPAQATIDAIINEFDNTIYPGDTTTFGSEPNPGIDNDAKIYIVLLDIKDGFSGSGGYVAGYFDPGSEYSTADFPASNQKEVFFMDIYPGIAGGPQFFNTLAHEFQHMIHWNQEQIYKNNANDDTWLNEAMSEIAPVYCGFGPSYSRVKTFEQNKTDSLTDWQDSLTDYGPAYMWAQYFKDRFEGTSPNIFKSMLQNNQIGIASVNAALTSGVTFTTTFRDWGIALYTGNTMTWMGSEKEWSYTSINTRPGSYVSQGVTYTLPGLFTTTTNTPSVSFSTPTIGGFAFFNFAPVSGPTGTVTWTAKTNSAETASLIDQLPFVNPDLVSGQAYTFTNSAYLVVSNPIGLYSAGVDTVTHTSLFQSVATVDPAEFAASSKVKTPKAKLDEVNNDPHINQLVQETGEPMPVCVHPYFKEKEKKLKAHGAKPGFKIKD